MGDARRRKLAGGPLVRVKTDPQIKPDLPLRSPEEVAAAVRAEGDAQAYIAAAIDFLYKTSEDALRQQTRRLLAVKLEP